MLTLALTALCATALLTQPAPIDDQWRTVTTPANQQLAYRIIPADSPSPTQHILLLPPGGQNREMVDIAVSLYIPDDAAARGWTVLAPTALAGSSMLEQASEIWTLVNTVLGPDASVHIVGVSNGGRAAFPVALAAPGRVRSITVLPGHAHDAATAQSLPRLKDIPRHIIVGEQDDAAWVTAAKRTHELLVSAGAPATLNLRAGDGHRINISAGELLAHLESTNRARQSASDRASADTAIRATLDALHDAASRADAQRYWSLFARDAVFLGTDPAERWTLDQFKAYANPIFGSGRGWTYQPVRRAVTVAPDAQTAWFDEDLANAKLGLCRGTGVLVREQGIWKIAQYTLTVPVPNDLMPRVIDIVREKQGPGDFQRGDPTQSPAGRCR